MFQVIILGDSGSVSLTLPLLVLPLLPLTYPLQGR